MAMDVKPLLSVMAGKGASDLFITAGRPPCVKVDGRLVGLGAEPLSPEQAMQMVLGTMNDTQRQEFETSKECNFAISAENIGRFRVSAFIQRNHAGMVLRRINTDIPTFEDLELPVVLQKLSMTKRGLIIFVGATGTGKSTSLAAMVGYRNRNSSGHIITIEDPIEFVHEHAGCIVTQREVGVDTDSYDIALKNTLRQAPDVILVGEVRNRETMDYAVAFAETGHLCLSTLHANNANQALDRIINFFPEDRRDQVLLDLSFNLKAIVAQQLIPDKSGTGRHVAVEILINTPLVSELIRKGEIHKLKELMKRSGQQGMQTFDQALFKHYKDGHITAEDAAHYADSGNEVRLMIKLDEGTHKDASSVFDDAELLGGNDGALKDVW